MTLDSLRQLLRPLTVKVANLVSRGVIKRVDDAKKVQELQVNLLDGETRDEVERFQQYGFTSAPVPGADGLFIAVGGRRDQLYCIGVEDQRTRIVNLQEGEVAVYSKHGQTIILKTNGDIEMTPKTGQALRVVGTSVELTGASNPVAKGDSLNSAINTLATALASAISSITTVSPGSATTTATTAAIAAFNASAAAALSTKVKIS